MTSAIMVAINYRLYSLIQTDLINKEVYTGAVLSLQRIYRSLYAL